LGRQDLPDNQDIIFFSFLQFLDETVKTQAAFLFFQQQVAARPINTMAES